LRALGFADAVASTGGARFTCDATGLARANLHARIASRIVVRLARFKALAFHELERAARRVEWARMLAPNAPFQLRVTARKSRLYHSDAIAQRVADAIARAVPGAVSVDAPDADDTLEHPSASLGVPFDATASRSCSWCASITTSAPSAPMRRVSCCIAAGIVRPSPRHRCARRWRRPCSRPRSTTRRNRWWIRSADRARC
jgi:hypothetical protein